MSNPTVTTEPAAEPVSVAEAKAQLRVDFDDDDTYIESLIGVARRSLERHCNRWFFERTGQWSQDRFPCGRELRLIAGLQLVASVKYFDAADVEATFDASNYLVRTKQEPGAVVLADGASWPATTLRAVDGVVVSFVAGYGEASDVPADIRHAILLQVTNLYRNRGDVDQPMPRAIADLLWNYRVVPCRKLAS